MNYMSIQFFLNAKQSKHIKISHGKMSENDEEKPILNYSFRLFFAIQAQKN